MDGVKKALGNMEGRRNNQNCDDFSREMVFCFAFERVMDVLSIIPHRIKHEFSLWKVLVANFSASASLSCQKKIMVYVFFQDEIRLGL